MKQLASLLLIFAGIALMLFGLYTGIVTLFIGGIVDLINQIKAPETENTAVAWGIAKIMFSEMIAGMIMFVGWGLVILGGYTIKDKL